MIDQGKLVAEPELIPESEFSERLEEWKASEGIDLVFTPDKNVAAELSVAELAHPGAVAIAKACGTECDTDNRRKLEPHYLRAPYITMPKKRLRK